MAFIHTYGYSLGSGQALIEHSESVFPLRRASGRGRPEVHRRPATVFPEGVQAAGMIALALARVPRLGSTSGGGGAGAALLARGSKEGIALTIERGLVHGLIILGADIFRCSPGLGPGYAAKSLIF